MTYRSINLYNGKDIMLNVEKHFQNKALYTGQTYTNSIGKQATSKVGVQIRRRTWKVWRRDALNSNRMNIVRVFLTVFRLNHYKKVLSSSKTTSEFFNHTVRVLNPKLLLLKI